MATSPALAAPLDRRRPRPTPDHDLQLPVGVQNGMFAEHWDELNLMQMFQQIGALPPLGGLQA